MTITGLSKWCTTLWNIPFYDSDYCPCLESQYKAERIHPPLPMKWVSEKHTHTKHTEILKRIDGLRTQLRFPGTSQEEFKVLITWTSNAAERSGKTPTGRPSRNGIFTTCKVAEHCVRFSVDLSKATEEWRATESCWIFCFLFVTVLMICVQ